MSAVPIIGITMGDPAGVGPEIIVKVFADERLYALCHPVVLGDAGVLSSVISMHDAGLTLNIIPGPEAFGFTPGRIDLMAVSRLEEDTVVPGRPTPEGGKAMVRYVIRAVEMARAGKLDAVVTCPINKALMQEAGFPYGGHTELISDRLNVAAPVMMLAGKRLRVALVTIHCALRDVPRMLSEDKIYRTVMITERALRQDFGIKGPRLAVAALNPHAGESGLFGSEDEVIIRPAVRRVRGEGVDAEGPLPPDTLFHKAASGRFDAVVAMYHDQGLIPLKLLHFSDAVNVTLGLPIVRTSVDHGTAYDIAGTWRADASSLEAAIQMAATMVRNRKKAAAQG